MTVQDAEAEIFCDGVNTLAPLGQCGMSQIVENGGAGLIEWEYVIVDYDADGEGFDFARIGREGWELVSVVLLDWSSFTSTDSFQFSETTHTESRVTLYFKRPMSESNPRYPEWANRFTCYG